MRRLNSGARRVKPSYDLDLSLAKTFTLGGTNANTELFRVVNAGSTAFNQLEEILAPRIFRLGLRFGF